MSSLNVTGSPVSSTVLGANGAPVVLPAKGSFTSAVEIECPSVLEVDLQIQYTSGSASGQCVLKWERFNGVIWVFESIENANTLVALAGGGLQTDVDFAQKRFPQTALGLGLSIGLSYAIATQGAQKIRVQFAESNPANAPGSIVVYYTHGFKSSI